MNKSRTLLEDLRSASPLKTALLVALLIFIITFSISSVFSRSMQQQNDEDLAAKAQQQTLGLRTHISTVSDKYSQLLLAASSIFAVNDQPTKQDWDAFIASVKVTSTYPESVGVGYAPAISTDKIGEFEAVAKGLTGDESYRVSHIGQSIATPILYIAPANDANRKVYGYDMYNDPVRRAAMDQARDIGGPVGTAPLMLAQDIRQNNTQATKGVLIYYPVYQAGINPSTAESRRASLRGFVYVALHPSDLIKQYLVQHKDEYVGATIRVEDITKNDEPIEVFRATGDQTIRRVSEKDDISLTERVWRVATDTPETALKQASPFVVFGLGTIASLLLAWTVYNYLISRLRHIERTYEGEVQRTKDELLALASHQLRTPASGVKQYIGMLTSGFFGELTPNQQSIAQKAFDANERQLEIINELLYVSKADAGQLVLEPKVFDMTALVQKCVDDAAEQAAHKNIALAFSSKKATRLVADNRYVAMAIDNLISNAIKYSYPSSTVHLKVTSSRGMVNFSVRDRGVGIAEDETEFIFDKFNRVDNPLSHSEGGSGLGLFLARQLIRAHGGDIVVQSVLEKGSTFTMSLPKKLTINGTIVNLNRVKRNDEEIS